MVQLVTTILKLLPLGAVIIFGFFYFNIEHFTPFNLSDEPAFFSITSTAALTLWAMLGLESGTIPADNILQPEKTIPRATVIGTLITVAVYLFSTVAVMGIIPPDVLAKSTAPFADAAMKMWGPFAAKIIAGGAAISCFGALNGWILLQGQVPYAVAVDGLLPKSLGRLSKKGTPVISIIISSIFVSLIMSLNYAGGLVEQFTFIILLATLSTMLPYIFSTMSGLLIILKDKKRYNNRTLIKESIIAVLAFIYSIWAMAGSGKDAVYWGFIFLMAGIPIYVWVKRRQN